MINITTLVFLIVLYAATRLYDRGKRMHDKLPVFGCQGVLRSYIESVKNGFRTKPAIEEACKKYGHRLFAFPLVGQWVVLARSKEHVREMYNAPEDVLSMEGAAEELLQLRHTVGPQFCDETYHIPAIKTSLNQNLSVILPVLVDEIVACFRDIVENAAVADAEWFPLDGLSTVSRIVCRSSTRVFVGSTLSQNQDYCRLASDFTSDTLTIGPIVKFLVPPFLRPIVGRVYRACYGHHRKMLKHLLPLIEARRLAHGSAHHNDMLSWLMATPDGESRPRSDESLAMRMLNVNFVAMHTTTKTLTHAIYHLAAQPMYTRILREEAEHYLGADPTQWTKEKLGRCIKLDSFFRETLRLNGLGSIWMPRLAMTDYTFADGTKISAGNFLATAANVIHEDDAIYAQPRTFDGLRFCNSKTAESKETVKEEEEGSPDDWMSRATGTSESYLSFGGGRHICPGRFFATMEMKCIMAYLVLQYDVMITSGVRPADEWYGPTSNPARNVEIMFRKRRY